MCNVSCLGAFDWTLMKDIWYQDGKGDGFVIAVKARRKKVEISQMTGRTLFLLLSSFLVGALYTINIWLAKKYLCIWLYYHICLVSLFYPAPLDLYFEYYFGATWMQWCKWSISKENKNRWRLNIVTKRSVICSSTSVNINHQGPHIKTLFFLVGVGGVLPTQTQHCAKLNSHEIMPEKLLKTIV